ncbi:MAG: hypothetical protein P8H57_00045 [Emcibacteraceae bacterium]|nr:hypothetical protein [Emcibacteraceae bacterium]
MNFKRNFRILFSGTALGYAASVLGLPILTRIYSPEVFEELGILTALVAICSSFMTGRLHIAIPLTKSLTDKVALFQISHIFIVFFGLLTFIVLYVVLPIFIQNTNLSLILYCTIVASIGMAVYNINIFWVNSQNDYSAIATTKYIRAIMGNGSQIIIGLISPTFFSLSLGYLIFCFSGILRLMKTTIKPYRVFGRLKASTYLRVLKKYKVYPSYSLMENAAINLGLYLPLLIIIANTGPDEGGQFFVASRVLSIPMLLLGSSVASLYIGHLSSLASEKEVASLTIRALKKLLIYASVPLIAIGILSPFVIEMILGSSWDLVGYFIICLCFSSSLQLATSPLAMFFHLTERVKFVSFLQMIFAFLKVIPLTLCVSYDTGYYIEIFSIMNFVSYLIFGATIFYSARSLEERC